jgi:hypothetical protein
VASLFVDATCRVGPIGERPPAIHSRTHRGA